MMDRDPERLLKAAANGSTAELLRAAEEEMAPAAVRERVLSTIAIILARAGESKAGVPLGTLSGVFERRDEGASVECDAGAAGGGALAVLRASSAAGGALGRSRTSRPESASGAPRALCSGWGTQLAAAVVAGVVLAKSLLLAAEGIAPSSDAAATPVALPAATTVAPRGPRSVTVQRTEPASAVPATVSAAGVSPLAEPDDSISPRDAISPRSVAPEAESPKEARSPEAEPRQTFAPNIRVRRGRPCAAGCSSPQHATRNVSSRVTAPAAYEGAIPRVEYDDDWLGEQLALLSQAERSLLAGNPGGALRSLDEYRARFPRGLLDPQIDALRERAQRSVESFMFP